MTLYVVDTRRVTSHDQGPPTRVVGVVGLLQLGAASDGYPPSTACPNARARSPMQDQLDFPREASLGERDAPRVGVRRHRRDTSRGFARWRSQLDLARQTRLAHAERQPAAFGLWRLARPTRGREHDLGAERGLSIGRTGPVLRSAPPRTGRSLAGQTFPSTAGGVSRPVVQDLVEVVGDVFVVEGDGV